MDKILTATAVPNDPHVRRAVRARRDRRARGLGPRGARRLPRRPAASKVGIIDTGIDRSHPEFAGRVSNCAQSTALFGVGGADPRRVRRRRRPRDEGGGHPRREGEQRHRHRRRRVQLAARDLPRARGRPRPRIDVERRQLHQLAAQPGREGHLDELRRRQLDDAPERDQERVEQRLRRGAARCRGQRRRLRHALPGRLPRGHLGRGHGRGGRLGRVEPQRRRRAGGARRRHPDHDLGGGYALRLRHLGGHAVRGRRRRAHAPEVPGRERRPDPQRARRGATDDLGSAGPRLLLRLRARQPLQAMGARSC